MLIKVIVNLPEDKEVLMDIASETIAKILLNRLKSNEINKLIEVLKKDVISNLECQ